MKSADWLGYYSARFQTVELNNAFYRLPDQQAFRIWAADVPDDFVFAVKASRYLTHIKRLQDPVGPVERLMGAARGLGPKLGPVLLQLPPNLRIDAEKLASTLKAFPRNSRVAVECRHPSWYDDRIRAVLEDHRAAWVLVDPEDRDRPRWRTADWAYVRFHRGRSTPAPCYGRSPLAPRHLGRKAVRDVAPDGGRLLLLQQRRPELRPQGRPAFRHRRHAGRPVAVEGSGPQGDPAENERVAPSALT